jgi:ribosomal protein S6
MDIKPEEAVNALTKLLNEKENIIRSLYIQLEALQGKLNEKEKENIIRSLYIQLEALQGKLNEKEKENAEPESKE